MNEDMRRVLQHIFVVLLLAAGPLLPSFHLATSPHRYCAEHQAFESIPDHPASGHDSEHHWPFPSDEPDEHETCLLATLMLQLVQHEPDMASLDSRPAPQPGGVAPPRSVVSGCGPALVFDAPKTSPPPVSPV